MCKVVKKGFIFLFLMFVTFGVFSEEYYIGKMLIFGWSFSKNDTSLQTNIAIDSLLKYVEAAKNQMISSERYNPSCKIGLYKDISRHNRSHDAVYIYINRDIIDDYFYRHIEVDFYIAQNAAKYKLILNSNDDYEWSEDTIDENTWELINRDDPAYNFFVFWIDALRR
jgi:hypothetical protein